MSTVQIRTAQKSDVPALLGIYAPYIRNTSITFEYDVPSEEEFARRVENITKAFPWLLCEIDGKIAGYAYAAPYKTRAAFQWDAELSVYLSPDFHRMGIATALYGCIQAILKEQGYLNLYTLITVPNPVSIGFHESCGFRPLCVYHGTGFKFGAWHDMAVLEKQLAPLPQVPSSCKACHELGRAFLEEQLRKAEARIAAQTS